MSTTETNAFMHRQPLGDLNDELRGLICTVRELDAQVTEENLTGDQLKEAFAELYPPSKLFCPEINTLPAMYPALRSWLNKRSAALTPNSSQRIPLTLANNIYTESEDANAVVDLAKGMIAQGRARPSFSAGSSSQVSQARNPAPSGDSYESTKSHKIWPCDFAMISLPVT